MTAQRQAVRALILDMDNTLYDWVSYFVPSLWVMVKRAAEILDTDEALLLRQLKGIHEQYGNTEQPYALLETAVVRESLPDHTTRARWTYLQPAFEAFEMERRDRLRLYSDVLGTLTSVRQVGCQTLGYTEASDVNISSRVRFLGLADKLDVIYAPRFRGPPHPLGNDRDRGGENDRVLVRTLPPNSAKPDPRILLYIASQIHVEPSSCLYVGDSLARDVEMAIEAGMMAAWAKYGTYHDAELWSKLVSISHWTSTAVAAASTSDGTKPSEEDYLKLDSFGELLEEYNFSP